MAQEDKLKSESLAQKALVSMAIRIALVVAILTGLSYFHAIQILKEQELNKLEKYVVERGQRERAIFKLALDNHETFKKEFLYQLKKMGNSDPQEEFDRLFVKQADGAYRNRPEIFDYTRDTSIFLPKNAPIDAETRRLMVLFYHLASQFGQAWNNRFADFFFQKIFISGIYMPSFSWAANTPADFDQTKEEYYWTSDPQHNPEQKSVWTGIYLDPNIKQWMVSAVTPVLDENGKWVCTVGNDVLLTELFDRTINDRLENTYNLLAQENGRLIAHPNYMKEIQDKQGNLNMRDSQDTHLKNIYEVLRSAKGDQHILDNPKNDEYLAVAEIPETKWYFITIYPKWIISRLALRSVIFILILGILSLIAEVSILYLVLKGKIADPLKSFIKAADEVASGKLDIQLDDRRKDELGHLATAFKSMAVEVERRGSKLGAYAEKLEKEVEVKTASLRVKLEESRCSEEALRQSEKHFRLLTSLAPVGIYETDTQGYCLYVNEKWQQITGFSLEKAKGTGWAAAIHPLEKQHVFSVWEEAAKSGKEFSMEFRFQRPDGHVATVFSHAVPIHDNANKITGYMGTASDITEQKQLEQAILQSEKMAAVGQLAAGVAHEINNPLGVILGFAQSLVKRLTSQDPLEMPLKSIEREAMRCKQLVQNLLTFSRIGKTDREETDLNQLIESSVSLIQAQAKVKNVELTVKLNEGIPQIFINQNQIQQVIVNLANNAIDAMPSGGTLIIRSQNADLNQKPAVQIEVEDTGAGIPKEIQERIFEPFFTTKEVGSGTGLGLSLVYEIIQKHEGQIKVESELGKGTLFRILLPKIPGSC